MPARLAGKIALITGASRGHRRGGRGAVRRRGRASRPDRRARSAASKKPTTGSAPPAAAATLVPFDLRDFIKIDDLAAALYERYGRLDILVANAGEFGVFSPIGHIDPRLWGEILDLNLTANWRLIRVDGPAVARRRARQGGVRDDRFGARGAALLRALRSQQGRARSDGQDLCRRSRRAPGCASI